MKADPLPPIPSPPAQRWERFRENVLPVAGFLTILVAAVLLWGANLANPLLMGQAEGQAVNIVSPTPGRLARLEVVLFQPVRRGDVIATVNAADPQILSNTVAVIETEMQAIRSGAGLNAGDRVRLAQFQMDWLAQRSELARLRAELDYAEGELTRVNGMFQEGISSTAQIDIARRDRDRLAREVAEKSAAVDAAEKALGGFDPAHGGLDTAPVRAQLAVAEQKLRLAEAELQPVVLRAPIDGFVTRIETAPEASVVRGATLAIVASEKVERIVGYIPHPVRLEPRVGMTLEVRSRGARRETAQAAVTHIGPRIELFDAPLRVRGMGAAQERGLPIIVSVPPGLHLRPGELVDLRLLTQ